MPFDPDAYLAKYGKKSQAPADDFDPDAYLSQFSKAGPYRAGFQPGPNEAPRQEFGPFRDGPRVPHPAPAQPGPWAGGYETGVPDTLQARRQPSQLEAAGRGLAQGATFGFADEMAGAGAYYQRAKDFYGDPDSPYLPETHAQGPQPGAEDYRRARDEQREADSLAREAHPKTFMASEIGGSLLVPVPGPKGTGILRAAGRGATSGGLYAAGTSEADLTKGEFGEFAEDVTKGAALGGAIGGATTASAKGVKRLGASVAEGLRRRILNEVAEGTASTTATARKRLDKIGDVVADEVIADGRLRSAYLSGSAETGRKMIEPLVAEAGDALDNAYGAFEAKGRSLVDLNAYMEKLNGKAKEALSRGQTDLADAITNYTDEMLRMAEASGWQVGLRQLRGFTTQTQRAASSALGSLNEHAAAKLKSRLQQISTEAMADTLESAATGDDALRSALASIRENNRRMTAYLGVDDALKLRQYKEATGESALVRGAKAVATPAAVGAAAGLASGEENRLESAVQGAVAGATLRALPAAARRVDRAITTAGISAQRAGLGPALGRAVDVGARMAVPPIVRARAKERDLEAERAKKVREAHGRR